jgi:hypothetical protein
MDTATGAELPLMASRLTIVFPMVFFTWRHFDPAPRAPGARCRLAASLDATHAPFWLPAARLLQLAG